MSVHFQVSKILLCPQLYFHNFKSKLNSSTKGLSTFPKEYKKIL